MKIIAVIATLSVVIAASAWFVYRRNASAPFEETKVTDVASPPPKGAPLEIAIIYPSGEDFADPQKILRYRMDRSDEWCAKVPTRQPWRREGKTIWLYAEDGIARATAGKPETSSGADGRATECYVDAEVRDVRSKRRYLFAAPHGHARLLPRTMAHVESGECRGDIETLVDLNGDGRITAIVNDGTSRFFCEGTNGRWRRF